MKSSILAAGILACLCAGCLPASAQPHHHSCRPRVQLYCPDLPPRPGTARICAARWRVSEPQFCHGRLPPPPARPVVVAPPGAVIVPQTAPPGYIPVPPPGYAPR